MQKKSRGTSSTSDFVRQLDAGEVESSMILSVTKDGERVYMHPFEDEVVALEFLEIMVAGFRNDLIEKALKRMVN